MSESSQCFYCEDIVVGNEFDSDRAKMCISCSEISCGECSDKLYLTEENDSPSLPCCLCNPSKKYAMAISISLAEVKGLEEDIAHEKRALLDLGVRSRIALEKSNSDDETDEKKDGDDDVVVVDDINNNNTTTAGSPEKKRKNIGKTNCLGQNIIIGKALSSALHGEEFTIDLGGVWNLPPVKPKYRGGEGEESDAKKANSDDN